MTQPAAAFNDARLSPVDPIAIDFEPAGPSRRHVLIGGGVVLLAVATTAACGSGASPAPAQTGPPTVRTTDVPLGGGEILTAQKIVITQPTAGNYRAFTAICTHRGCIVATIADGLIKCPCHNSEYSILNGSVKRGPAPAPLAPVAITVSGSTITFA